MIVPFRRCHLVAGDRSLKLRAYAGRAAASWHPRHDSITLPDRRPSHGRNTIIKTEDSTTLLATRRLATNSRITYNGECECGNTFASHDARRKYCDECGTPAARVARHRANPSTPRLDS